MGEKKIIKCSIGHFYDADKYSECPHCKKNDLSEKKIKTDLKTDNDESFSNIRGKIDFNGSSLGLKAGENRATDIKIIPDSDFIPFREPVFRLQKGVDVEEDITLEIPASEIEEYLNGDIEKKNEESSYEASTQISDNVEEKRYPSVRNMTYIMGWVVCISGKMKGTFLSLYGRSNPVGGMMIDLDSKTQLFYVAKLKSTQKILVNDIEISDIRLLSHHDVIDNGSEKYLLVMLCNGGFSWDK